MSALAPSVLVADDEPSIRFVLRETLAELGWDVAEADDGESALEYLKDHAPRNTPGRPHLILLDLRLPRMDGLEVLREIKAAPDLADIPCVVLTTSHAEGDMLKAYRLHANSYLVKPGDYQRFVELMAGIERYWLEANVQPKGPVAGGTP